MTDKYSYLENPTVKDLIEFLSCFDKEKHVLITDPDTGWNINIFHFKENENIYITGCYDEMIS